MTLPRRLTQALPRASVSLHGARTRILSSSCRLLPVRSLATETPMVHRDDKPRAQKEEGSISSIFTSLLGQSPTILPKRFSDLKKLLWKDTMVQSWREVLSELDVSTKEISRMGADIIPRVKYADIVNGLTDEQVKAVKKCGVIIVAGGVPKEEALAWKQSLKDYLASNSQRVKGFPPENIQVYEIYNSPTQTSARTHPSIINTHRFLLSLWHTSPLAPSSLSSAISLSTPISYFDRLRMRMPGDVAFTLGPHIDGGSVERWEDEGFRRWYGKVLNGGSAWREHDPWDSSKRIHAKGDLYNAPNQCSIFRPWQGWTSLSSTGPNQGTLRVLPMLHLASAYLVLRPFFRPISSTSSSLRYEDWEVDLEGTDFPGSGLGKAQELSEATHPHLKLDKTMVSIPSVEPGDQVYWHCDTVHAVEPHHRGTGDSTVLYIPVVPLTLDNAYYLRDQRTNFLSGLPPPDFPGGEGESKFVDRPRADDVVPNEARRVLGLSTFEAHGTDLPLIEEVNRVLHQNSVCL